WTPPQMLSARLSDKNQEHCVVYNMIRLADYLFRWTGDAQYADYIERNLHNGILAQQHPQTGMVTYFLPLAPGSKKTWGTPTDDFWCCHGTLVQAQSRHDRYIYFSDGSDIVIAQYIPSEALWSCRGTPVRISQTMLREADDHRVDMERDPDSRPGHWAIEIRVDADQPVEFSLRLRLPSWLRSPATVHIEGQEQSTEAPSSGYLSLKRVWRHEQVRIVFPKGLTASLLPDRPDTVAFLDGPVLLAALTEGAVTLSGDAGKPDTLLV